MASTTHPHAFKFDRAVDSYWEASADPLDIGTPRLKGDETCEVAVIGAGFTGLSAALELAQQGVDVRVLEAGQVGWGASGRNGGFACVGSHKLSYPTMIRRYGLEAAQQFYDTMRQSVALVRDNLQHYGIDAWATADGEVTLAHLPSRVQELRDEQAYLKQTFGDETEFLSKEDLKRQGLDGPGFFAGLKGKVGFGVHPLNYVRGLARTAATAGAKIHGRSQLIRWEELADGHRLHTREGLLKAKQVIVATNGYTPEDVSKRHAGRIMPALSSVIVTRPLTDEERRAQGWTSDVPSYDSRRLLHYFRLLPNGRFLFGGRGGTDASDSGGDAYRPVLLKAFAELFPAWAEVEITHYWRGFVCLSHDLVPYVGALDEKKTVWTAIAYHGNGVAMGSWSGRAVARLLTKKTARDELSPVLTRRLSRFPLPAFRPLYLKGAYVWYGWEDSR
ncbi:MAG: FAD-binding oxidoreductase [Aestuariivirga sp.]|uniref:NAD(P)/FAD-dependent oxidoreductase n=1 Tax=Aestuariivirga sp. TaxID=2650926 RepID=UPI0025BD57E4|nr:FAD-binding oxidoreductase [Aestuariivirga sp.]MCA3560745.1 FAD-binding oxidoreductase [Aestuariivirga sp.]